MIYLMSDLHGDFSAPGLLDYSANASADDLLILLGDTELNLADGADFEERSRRFLAIDKPIALLDGNHENYPFLNSFPVEEWHGGLVNRITPTLVHLKRGEIYTIEGRTFFAMGGWKSSDKWHDMGLWYPEEMPSDEELAYGLDALKKAGNKVDYILTHNFNPWPDESGRETPLREFCRYVEDHVTFRHWYFGHCHIERDVDDKHKIVYRRPVPAFEENA